jgi:hypothetical protein
MKAYFTKILDPCLPWTPKMPVPIEDLPFYDTVLHFKDIQIGIPESNSSMITPNDHMS